MVDYGIQEASGDDDMGAWRRVFGKEDPKLLEKDLRARLAVPIEQSRASTKLSTDAGTDRE